MKPLFTARHYELLAQEFRGRNSINIQELCAFFAKDNPRFDRDRFLVAMGLKKPDTKVR